MLLSGVASLVVIAAALVVRSRWACGRGYLSPGHRSLSERIGKYLGNGSPAAAEVFDTLLDKEKAAFIAIASAPSAGNPFEFLVKEQPYCPPRLQPATSRFRRLSPL